MLSEEGKCSVFPLEMLNFRCKVTELGEALQYPFLGIFIIPFQCDVLALPSISCSAGRKTGSACRKSGRRML